MQSGKVIGADVWDAESKTALERLWNLGVPTLIIAVLMDRSKPSIQTRTSRILTPRSTPIYAIRTRERWTIGDFAALEELVADCGGKVSFAKLNEFSRRVKREIGTIVNKLNDRYGPDSLTTLVDDYRNNRFVTTEERSGPPGAPPGTNKRCIGSGCRSWFWAKNRKTDWYCQKCRKAYEGQSSDDADFFCY